MSLSVTITGTAELKANLARLGDQARPAIATALYQEAEAIMAESKERYVPVDMGVLRASGHVQPPQMNGDEVSVTMGFGGAASAYAIVQHENLTYRHPVGGSKYLELPLMAAASGIAQKLADRVRGVFR